MSLHRHLFSLLDRPITTLKFATKRNGIGGECVFDDHYPPSYIRITIDANANENVRFVIHELLHVVLSETVLGKFDNTLEEVFVLGLDQYMWNFVKASPVRLKKWEALIQKKLAENPPLPDVSLEDLADRRADEPKN